MHAAIYRKTSNGETIDKHERLTFKEAFDLYTKNGAFCGGEETRLGMIKPGFLADFIAIDEKIWGNWTPELNSNDQVIWGVYETEEMEKSLLNCKVDATFVGGILSFFRKR